MNNLRHPNIVLYMGVCLYQSQYFMITEYLKEGSLFDHLHKHKTNFSETNLITMIEDMALGSLKRLKGFKNIFILQFTCVCH